MTTENVAEAVSAPSTHEEEPEIEEEMPEPAPPKPIAVPSTPADLDLLTYEEIIERFTIKEGEDQLEEGEEEVDFIIDHNEECEGEFSYLLRWLNADPKHDSWHHQSDLVACEAQGRYRNRLLQYTNQFIGKW